MYTKKMHLIIWSLLLLLAVGCSENPTSVIEEENNLLRKSGPDETLNSHVFLRGYVTNNGRPLRNHRIQILDENRNPFDYYPYSSKIDVAYTNSSGYYEILVCGFHPGLRYVTSSFRGATKTYAFTIPQDRNGPANEYVYITRNITFGDEAVR